MNLDHIRMIRFTNVILPMPNSTTVVRLNHYFNFLNFKFLNFLIHKWNYNCKIKNQLWEPKISERNYWHFMWINKHGFYIWNKFDYFFHLVLLITLFWNLNLNASNTCWIFKLMVNFSQFIITKHKVQHIELQNLIDWVEFNKFLTYVSILNT